MKHRIGRASGAIALALVFTLGAISCGRADTIQDAGGAAPARAAGAVMASPGVAPATTATAAILPRLVDLGSGKCIPCKLMAPILEELRKEYQGRMEVVFIDVWEEPDEGKKYGIRVIPTQIFYDAAGKERFRHEGFYSKDDILKKWKSLGVDLAAAPEK